MDFSVLLKRINLDEFHNIEILKEALTHKSFSKSHNERLEFLGDAVLELVITELLFTDYPDKQEGILTSFRAAIVRSESLYAEAIKLGLGEFIRMSKGEEATGGRTRMYILADVFEAVVGAIYLDQGYDTAKRFIQTHLYYKISDIANSRSDIDPKSRLQELAQEKFKETPYYKLVKEEGPDHDKMFTVIVSIGNTDYEMGSGRSKQIAEQEAAGNTLRKIEGANLINN